MVIDVGREVTAGHGVKGGGAQLPLCDITVWNRAWISASEEKKFSYRQSRGTTLLEGPRRISQPCLQCRYSLWLS